VTVVIPTFISSASGKSRTTYARSLSVHSSSSTSHWVGASPNNDLHHGTRATAEPGPSNRIFKPGFSRSHACRSRMKASSQASQIATSAVTRSIDVMLNWKRRRLGRTAAMVLIVTAADPLLADAPVRTSRTRVADSPDGRTGWAAEHRQDIVPRHHWNPRRMGNAWGIGRLTKRMRFPDDYAANAVTPRRNADLSLTFRGGLYEVADLQVSEMARPISDHQPYIRGILE
jgi:hypothetical protein